MSVNNNSEPLDISLVQIPHHFRCPISLELMTEPVTISTGQTYDRASIESWLDAGNATCPVTRIPLSDFTLIPNHTLRRLIQQWASSNLTFGPNQIPSPTRPTNPTTIRTLLNQATSERTTPHSRLNALSQLRKLANDSDTNRSLINKSQNLRKTLLHLLFDSTDSECFDLKHESLGLLIRCSLSESDIFSVVSKPERINYLSRLLFHSSIEVRVNSAELIESVLSQTRSPEMRLQICNVGEIYEGIVNILKSSHVSYPRALKTGVKAMFGLCLMKQTRCKAVAAGAAEVLIDRIGEFERCDCERALVVVELLCRVPAGLAAIVSHAPAVTQLVKVVMSVSERATENAVGALLAVCSENEKCQREAVAARVLTPLLLVVQSECSERVKSKAKMLLKLLRDSWPHDYCVGNSDDFACSELVVPF